MVSSYRPAMGDDWRYLQPNRSWYERSDWLNWILVGNVPSEMRFVSHETEIRFQAISRRELSPTYFCSKYQDLLPYVSWPTLKPHMKMYPLLTVKEQHYPPGIGRTNTQTRVRQDWLIFLRLNRSLVPGTTYGTIRMWVARGSSSPTVLYGFSGSQSSTCVWFYGSHVLPRHARRAEY
jgi:hypothetical protein